MSVFKPIRIFWQTDIDGWHRLAALRAVSQFLSLVDELSGQKLKIERGGLFDIDKYIEKGNPNDPGFGSLDENILCNDLYNRQLSDGNLYHSLLITKEKIYRRSSSRFLLGLARKHEFALIGLYEIVSINDPRFIKELSDTVFHEFGHLSGLLPDKRTEQVIKDQDGHNHCSNKRCVMSLYVSILQTDGDDYPFCSFCLRDLRDFFKNSV